MFFFSFSKMNLSFQYLVVRLSKLITMKEEGLENTILIYDHSIKDNKRLADWDIFLNKDAFMYQLKNN